MRMLNFLIIHHIYFYFINNNMRQICYLHKANEDCSRLHKGLEKFLFKNIIKITTLKAFYLCSIYQITLLIS